MAGVRARVRAAAEAAKTRGFRAAVEAFVLGPDRARALERALVAEPLVLWPLDPTSLSPLDRRFARCSDIYAHLPDLYKTTVDRRLRRVLELGTRTGESTVALLAAAREIGGRVTSVDLDDCPEAKALVREMGLEPLWTFLRSDDLALDWRDPVDHLFIDTSHRYDHTLRELGKYEPLVAPGGVITMHDTTSYTDVWRAVQAYFAGRQDVRIFRYFHNNGLAVIEKAAPPL